MFRKWHTKRVLALAAWIGLSALPASAAPHVQIHQAIRLSANYNQGRIAIVASDSQGHLLRYLQASQFAVSLDGLPARLTHTERITAEDPPLSVLLLLDISKSMRGGGAIQASRSAALGFLQRLGHQDSAGVMTLGSTVRRLAGFTRNKALLRQRLARLEATDDWTLLYQALYEAAAETALAPTGRVAIVVLTDGKDEGSALTLEEAVREVRAQNVACFTLGFGPHADHKTLKRLAALTGGRYFYAPTAATLPTLYRAVWDELKTGYALELQTAPLSPGPHTLAVTLTYQGERAVETQRFVIPSPPLPRWLSLTSLAVFGLLVLLAGIGYALTRASVKKSSAAPPPIPSAWLDVKAGPQRGRRVRLSDSLLRIGSEEGCELRLLGDARVDAHQADLRLSPEGVFTLTSCSRVNVTRLNGNSLAPGQEVRLRDGDQIRIGATDLHFIDRRYRQGAEASRDVRARAAAV